MEITKRKYITTITYDKICNGVKKTCRESFFDKKYVDIRVNEINNREYDKEYKIDQDNATKITVAQLNAYRGSENMDQDMNGIPDPIEIGNQEIARQKAVSDAMSKQMDLANKARAEENKKELEKRKIAAQEKADKLKATIEKEKIALENRKLQEAKRLQKMKDDAAYKREQLKAKTALKNKVVGESKSKK